MGAVGRVEVVGASLAGVVSFLDFFAILLLRCSPLGMSFSRVSFNVPALSVTPSG